MSIHTKILIFSIVVFGIFISFLVVKKVTTEIRKPTEFVGFENVRDPKPKPSVKNEVTNEPSTTSPTPPPTTTNKLTAEEIALLRSLFSYEVPTFNYTLPPKTSNSLPPQINNNEPSEEALELARKHAQEDCDLAKSQLDSAYSRALVSENQKFDIAKNDAAGSSKTLGLIVVQHSNNLKNLKSAYDANISNLISSGCVF